MAVKKEDAPKQDKAPAKDAPSQKAVPPKPKKKNPSDGALSFDFSLFLGEGQQASLFMLLLK